MRRHALWGSLALGVGCHLIGGAGDIVFQRAVGGGGAGNAGGAGGCDCENPCEECNMAGICERLPEGTLCQTSGECTASGLCLEGAVEWVRTFGSDEDDEPTVVFPLGDEVFVAGGYSTDTVPLDFDGTGYNSADTANDGFMLRLDAADGAVVWSASMEHFDEIQRIEAAAPDGRGGVLVAGRYRNQVGAPPISSPTAPAGMQAFLFDIDIDGATDIGLWGWMTHAVVAQAWVSQAKAVALSSSGDVVVAGDGDDGFDPVPGSYIMGGPGLWVAVVENFDSPQPGRVPASAANWVDCTTGPVTTSDVVVDAMNRIWAVGEVTATDCDLGNVLEPVMGTASFIVRYDTISGTAKMPPDDVIAYRNASDPNTAIRARALVANGSDLYVAGHFRGVSTIGDGPAGNPDPYDDVFVAREGPSPWLKTFDASNGVEIYDMARDSQGYLVVVGALLTGSELVLDPDDESKNIETQSKNPLIFKLDATGAPVWSRSIIIPANADAVSVAIDADDHILVAGRTRANVPGTLDVWVNANDIFVLKMTP